MATNPLIEMLVQSLAESELVLALFDPSDKLQWANRRYHDIFLRGLALPVGFPDILRHGFHGGFGVRIDSGDIEQFLADILPRRRKTQFRKFATDTVDGTWLWMTETLQPNGWLLSSASDITDLKLRERGLRRAHEDAVKSAERDATTGALNRQQILATIERAVEQAEVGRPVCVAAFDLPQFNPSFLRSGHQGADQGAARFAKRCMSQLRPGDCFGRTGTGEFLMLLRDVRGSLAERIVKRLQSSLARSNDEPIDVVAGVVERGVGESSADLLQRLANKLSSARAGAADGSAGR